MEVAMTRIFFAPDSTSCRTRCAPRKPVPPVIRVVGGTFLTMAACFFVLFLGTICAVRFFGGVLGISNYYPQITQKGDSFRYQQREIVPSHRKYQAPVVSCFP